MASFSTENNSTTLEDRLAYEAKRLREQAKELPPGCGKARQTETASHMSEWLRSPGLQPQGEY
jgi:hypothetical protein